MKPIHRRNFIETLGLTGVGVLLSPLLIHKRVLAYTGLQKTNQASSSLGKSSPKTFVLIIQRGAMDGLSLLPAISDPHYLALRPNIGLKPGQGSDSPLSVDGQFGLHPAMTALKPFWDEKTLAFIQQAGSPDSTRSHFDAQDFLESGTPGRKTTTDGFLNRALQALEPSSMRNALRGVAMQPSMPRALQGRTAALSMGALRDFNLNSGEGFESMYSQAADRIFRGAGQEAFESLRSVADLSKANNKDDEHYPKTQIAKRLRDIASLIKANLGVQIAVTDIGGWDTHIYQGAAHGQLADRFKELSEALAAFARDLGPKFSDVCVACTTEFGRTVKENGTRGTDHGHGSVMTILGGSVQGGKVYGKWKGLAKSELFEGRDLPVTTDYRDVFSELFARHLGMKDLANVFPGHLSSESKWLGLI